MLVELHSLASPIRPAEKTLVRQVMKRVEAFFGLPAEAEVSLVWLSPAKIHQLNLKHRRKDRPTTTLSFPTDAARWGKRRRTKQTLESNHLGEIFFCRRLIEQEARRLKVSYPQRLRYITLHSALHLLGYDHRTDAEEREMEKLSEQILNTGS